MNGLYPTNINQLLEFDKMLVLASNYALGSLGSQKVLTSTFSNKHELISHHLDEVNEVKSIIDSGNSLPIVNYDDITLFLGFLKIEHYVLEQEEILQIRNILSIRAALDKFLLSIKQKINTPLLILFLAKHEYLDDYLKKINQVLDEKGDIKNNASEALIKIRQGQKHKRNEIDGLFNQLLSQYKKNGILTESAESYRNGRRVLALPVENKRRIKGIIHDESATGKTVYMEPELVILLNNELSELEHEEKREIYKILKILCSVLANGRVHFENYLLQIGHIDFLRAKALLAIEYKGIKPTVVNKPYFKINKGIHPLLYIKNRKANLVTVPFDLELNQEKQMIVVSGPNAGGKSVLLKSLGLLQLMFQSGFLVPMSIDSEMGVIEKIFVSIGDQQSLEDDLSTYSSHLKCMKYFLDHANEQTLILIDEFGGGTDPDVGGAIAESILHYLMQRNTWGMITTHYSILKLFAHNNSGIINGSMLFNTDDLKPTFIFKSGNPGSSFAFELAKNNKLPKSVITSAEKKIGKEKNKVENLLNDLQSKKLEIEKEFEILKKRQFELTKIIKIYEQQSKDFDIKRLKLRTELKEFQLNKMNFEEQALDQTIKKVVESNKLDDIRALALKKKEEKLNLIQNIQLLKNDVRLSHNSRQINKTLEIGDFVRLKANQTTGYVNKIEKNKVTIHHGDLQYVVEKTEIIIEKAPISLIKEKKVISNLIHKTQSIESKLDVRGLKYEEAIQKVEEYVDLALIKGKAQIQILHGKGSGILKRAVREKLKEYHHPMKIYHPSPDLGGDGITIVEFE